MLTHGPANNLTGEQNESQVNGSTKFDSIEIYKKKLPAIKESIPSIEVITKKVKADSLVEFAKLFIGTPYLYASTDPSKGFDCSGFITYVFNHYNISVPRSSKDFENVGTEIPINSSKTGDLILFTGTDSTEKVIGHMGIVVSNNSDGLRFIHSTSGKSYGVVVTDFNQYYRGRFVKTIRVFN